jgi:hypothetical protein
VVPPHGPARHSHGEFRRGFARCCRNNLHGLNSDNGGTGMGWLNTISSANRTKTTTIGTSQYFFSLRRTCQNSDSTQTRVVMSDSLPAALQHSANQFEGQVRQAERDEILDQSL